MVGWHDRFAGTYDLASLALTASSTEECLRGCLEALARCRALVERLGPERFATPVGRHATVGAHLRHCLDHFDRFFDGLPLGTIDYDARERRADWETNAAVALDVIAQFERRLAALAPEADRLAALPLNVWQSVASGIDTRRMATSSLDRELTFLSSHTIHHLAVMGVVIDLAGWGEADEDMGVAYSTRAHHTTSATNR